MQSNDQLLSEIRQSIDSGAAICLLGAGFSLGAKLADTDADVPSTADLTKELKSLFQIPENELISLAEVAEFANETQEGKRRLVSHLVRRLTSTAPTDYQKKFVNLNWRSIFTTNFDDIVEQCSDMRRRVAITPQSDSSTISADLTPIYYMHGRALDVRESDADPSLVISETNYLRLEQRNRDLYSRFFNEIACARLIVLVGYSLRDLEIASGIIAAGSSARSKTYIVTSPFDSDFTKQRLLKFGTVIDCGLEQFIKLYEQQEPSISGSASFEFLSEDKIDDSVTENQAEDFLAFTVTGKFEAGNYVRQMIAGDEPYCIERASVREVLNADVNRFIVSADFGNGKTAFLDQLSVNFLKKGCRVFRVDTRLPEVFEDIEKALQLTTPVVFLVDDVLRYRAVARFIGERLHGEAVLVCTTRGDLDTRTDAVASELGGACRSIDLNKLSGQEIEQWDALLERWGYWEDRAGDTDEKRINFLVKDCGSENRSIVLSLFRSSKISRTIDNIIDFFLNENRDNKDAFAGLLVSSLCQRHVSWESIVNWLGIDEEKLRTDIENSNVKFLFMRGRMWNLFTSSQLADYILRHKFVGDYDEYRDILVSVYSRIVLSTASSANDSRSGWDFQENLKELVKYRFLTRLFGDSSSSITLIGRVYRTLSSAPRIRDNPQFWLQYAMSRMAADDLEGAETYIRTALSKAEGRGKDYSPFQILDQRARLYFRKNNSRSDGYSDMEIRIALKDLLKLAHNDEYDIVYTMRSIPLIEEFVEKYIDEVSGDVRKLLADLLNLIHEIAGGYERLPRSQKGETKVLKRSLSNARLVLFNA